MTSLRLRLHASAAGLSIAGLLALSACPAGDDTAEGSETNAATTMPMGMTDTGTEESEASGTPQDSSGGGSLSHAVDIQPIWDEHCVEACHVTGGEWAILDMSGDAYENIVGVAAATFGSMNHVEPGEPDNSYLLHKIKGTQVEAGGNGLDMPKARTGMEATVMTQEQIDLIEEWIEAGAPE